MKKRTFVWVLTQNSAFEYENSGDCTVYADRATAVKKFTKLVKDAKKVIKDNGSTIGTLSSKDVNDVDYICEESGDINNDQDNLSFSIYANGRYVEDHIDVTLQYRIVQVNPKRSTVSK